MQYLSLLLWALIFVAATVLLALALGWVYG